MSPERLTIIPHTRGRGFDIPFPKGTVSVPDAPGGYCISSGCGSGKTESVKSLIRQKYNDGILYCADTISECQRMYDWVRAELVDGVSLLESDVMMINSQADLESMKTYQDHPEYICRKKVLIVVQVRFFTELINFFLLYRPSTPPQEFDGDFRGLMASGELRKYVLFDETPLFLKPFRTVTKGELAPYALRSSSSWKCKKPSDVSDIYQNFIRGDRKTDYFHGSTRLSRIKNDTVIGLIPKLFDSWMAQKGKEYHIQFWPSDLVQPGMKSHVLLYEGAGDILLGSSKKFKLLDVPVKYNSIVVFHRFDFGLSRTKMPDDREYEGFVTSLHNILNVCQGRTLITIWKDFRGGRLSEKQEETYTRKLQDALVAEGVPTGSFTVTYYGAADTKSTNSYRDCQNIILGGNWWLGTSVMQRLKRGFDCQNTCMENYMMWYYIQLLLRIGIRNNTGGTYHVFYSSDHDESFKSRLSVYLNQNIFIPKRIKTGTPLWEMMILNYKMGKYYLPALRKLVGREPGLRTAIETGQPYNYIITLKDIAQLIPKKKRPQKDNYRRLVGFLGKIKILLQITR